MMILILPGPPESHVCVPLTDGAEQMVILIPRAIWEAYLKLWTMADSDFYFDRTLAADRTSEGHMGGLLVTTGPVQMVILILTGLFLSTGLLRAMWVASCSSSARSASFSKALSI
jgi:hypothetical protein